jgi:hypothetical protein
MEPVIAGMASRKEKRAASFLDILENNPELIVIPDLDIPGKIANIWAIPIIIAFLRLIS